MVRRVGSERAAVQGWGAAESGTNATMDAKEFFKLCRDTRIIDKSRITKTTCQSVFAAANAGGVDTNAAAIFGTSAKEGQPEVVAGGTAAAAGS